MREVQEISARLKRHTSSLHRVTASHSSTGAHGSALYLHILNWSRPYGLTSWGCAKFIVPGVVSDKTTVGGGG